MKTTDAPWKPRKQSVNRNTVAPADHPAEPKKPYSRVEKLPSADEDHGPFPLQQLLRIARQSGIAEPLACASSLNLLTSGRAVHHSLIRVLKPLGLSEARFFALVTLYTLDPSPLSPADLAYHTEITRPAMTGLLDTMAERGWICRKRRLTKDRRFSRVSLTDKGREVTVFAIYQFLKSAAEIAEDLKPEQHLLFDKLCALLRRRSL